MTTLAVSVEAEYLMAYWVGVEVAAAVAVEDDVFDQAKDGVARPWVAVIGGRGCIIFGGGRGLLY